MIGFGYTVPQGSDVPAEIGKSVKYYRKVIA